VTQPTPLTMLRETLRVLEDFVASAPDQSEVDRAEGYLFVAGLLKWGMDRAVVGADTQRPRFIRFTDTHSKWGLGNPDNLYLLAEIDPAEQYVIHGQRGTCVDLIIEARTGIGRREDDVHSETLAYIEARNLLVGRDGRFEVRLGGPPQEGNHLPLSERATTIFARQTHGDWMTETPAILHIEKLGPAPPPVPRPSLVEAEAMLGRAASVVLALARFNDKTAAQWAASMTVNAFPEPTTKVGDGFFPGQFSAIGQFHLRDPREALVVTMDPVDADYLGFSIGHLKWYLPLDYHNRQCSMNTAQARPSSDGRFRYVISATDPGIPNWIDTGGVLKGFMFFRGQRLRGAGLPQPRTRLVPIAGVREEFPAEEPGVTPAERREAVRQRQLSVFRRYSY
jgi:hypothetical protein